jgi:hypothetical protein
MNYLGKYNEIIALAKLHEPECVAGKSYYARKGLGPEGYHHHHIKPRCEGTDHSADNIVTLPIKEHAMAHWFYAKHYGGVHWSSVMAIIGCADREWVKGLSESEVESFAEIYAEAMRKRSDGMQGDGNHFYGKRHTVSALQKMKDMTEYQFFHLDGSTFIGTREAFEKHTGIAARLVCGIILGQKKRSHGWFTSNGNPKGQTQKEDMKDVWRNRQKVVTLYHKDGDVWAGYPVDAPINYSNLARTKNSHVGGWFESIEDRDGYAQRRAAMAKLAAESRGDISGNNNPMAGSDRRKDIPISVYNKAGETFVGSSKDFADAQGFSTSQYGAFIKIMRGKKKVNGAVIKSYKGWYPA